MLFLSRVFATWLFIHDSSMSCLLASICVPMLLPAEPPGPAPSWQSCWALRMSLDKIPQSCIKTCSLMSLCLYCKCQWGIGMGSWYLQRKISISGLLFQAGRKVEKQTSQWLILGYFPTLFSKLTCCTQNVLQNSLYLLYDTVFLTFIQNVQCFIHHRIQRDTRAVIFKVNQWGDSIIDNLAYLSS